MPTPIEQWHQIVRSRDLAALERLLADDVVFVSPVVHTPQPGKAITTKYLQAALQVLNNETFTYLNEWYGADSAVLEFQSTVDGIVINGIDMIGWNEAGRIDRFKVMVRPLKAMNKLHEHMGRMLAAG
ncbi:MAG: nuclear transport factor 2 family protein [Burkholderiales bacterium]|nr:nuclear transport factor 2 family protein [Burkholderiales bacterium]